MNKYKIEFGEGDIFLYPGYTLILVHEENSRLEFPNPSPEFESIGEAVEARKVLEATIPSGQHYRIFKKRYEMIG